MINKVKEQNKSKLRTHESKNLNGQEKSQKDQYQYLLVVVS